MITKLMGVSPFIILAGVLVFFLLFFISLRKVLLWYWKLDDISRTLKDILSEIRKR